jgi:hypothetical protein
MDPRDIQLPLVNAVFRLTPQQVQALLNGTSSF